MKTVLLFFDSLNRLALETYGGTGIQSPNTRRLAERAVRFDNHYVGSLPCMPARRDLHTGRLNFLHRSWGPLEPYDNSMVAMLRRQGVYAHLVSDHFHYFTEGGATYHTQYSSWDFIRGQEADRWQAMVRPPVERFRETYHPKQVNLADDRYLAHMVNREFIKEEADFPMVQCFESAFAFLDRNRDQDNFFLQLECFDPHEPFFAPRAYRERYPDAGYRGPILDWPRYDRVSESAQEIAELRTNYAALVTMCDAYLGRLLDYFDAHDLWRDTALVLTTDHGFLLGEHDWWAKNRMPFYNEISHIPLLVYHPSFAAQGGSARRALTQSIDLMPTLLDFFGMAAPPEAEGTSLRPLLAGDGDHRPAVIYGMFGGATNVTDGRYTYFLYPERIESQELYEYTLMPVHMRSFFQPEEFRGMTLAEPFNFSKGIPLMRMAARPALKVGRMEDTTTALYDLARDPGQMTPIEDVAVKARLTAEMVRLMIRNDAPDEAFARLGLARN